MWCGPGPNSASWTNLPLSPYCWPYTGCACASSMRARAASTQSGPRPTAAVVGVVVAGRARLDAREHAPALQQVVAGQQQVTAFEQAQQLVVGDARVDEVTEQRELGLRRAGKPDATAVAFVAREVLRDVCDESCDLVERRRVLAREPSADLEAVEEPVARERVAACVDLRCELELRRQVLDRLARRDDLRAGALPEVVELARCRGTARPRSRIDRAPQHRLGRCDRIRLRAQPGDLLGECVVIGGALLVGGRVARRRARHVRRSATRDSPAARAAHRRRRGRRARRRSRCDRRWPPCRRSSSGTTTRGRGARRRRPGRSSTWPAP